MKAFFSVVTAALLMTATHASYGTEKSDQPVVDSDLVSMLTKVSEAKPAFYNGQPDAAKALWSHADNVTLTGQPVVQPPGDGTRSVKDLAGQAHNS